jgi:hypothetical protein
MSLNIDVHLLKSVVANDSEDSINVLGKAKNITFVSLSPGSFEQLAYYLGIILYALIFPRKFSHFCHVQL